MHENEWKKIWRKLYVKLSEIEGLRGATFFQEIVFFYLMCENKWKKKIPTKFLLREKRFWQEIQILLGIVSFSRRNFLLFFFCVKQSKKNGLGRRTTFFPSKWKKKLFWGNVAFHWWKIKFWPENLFFFPGFTPGK